MKLFMLCYFAFLLFLALIRKKATKGFIIFNVVLLIVIMIVFSLKIYPPKTTQFPISIQAFDLYRYYWQMDLIRNSSSAAIREFIFEKVWFGFRILEYVVANISNNNNTIFLLTIPITIGAFGYIVYDVIDNMKIKFSRFQIVVFILCFLSLINPLHLLSGIRNALAVSIFSFGFYKYIMKNQHKSGIIFILLSITIHPMVLIYLLIYFFTNLVKKINKIEYLILIFILLIFPLSNTLFNIIGSIGILPNFISEKLIFYSEEERYYSIYNLILELLQLFIFLRLIVNVKKSEKSVFFKYLYYLWLFNIGLIVNSTIFTRIKFLYAFILPILMAYCIKNKIKTKNTEIMLFVISTIIYFKYLVQFLDYIKIV